MAKSSASNATGPKEPSQPLVISLVFFVLLSIGLGVFCYVLYSDQKAKDEAVAKAAGEVKNLRAEAKDNELIAKAQRVFLGTAEPADRETVLAEVKEGDKPYQEIQKMNAAAKAAAGAAGKGGDPKADDFAVWTVGGGPLAPPATSLIELAAKARVARDLAVKERDAERAGYDAAREVMAKAAAAYQKAEKLFESSGNKLTGDFKDKMKQIEDLADKRALEYTASVKVARDESQKHQEDLAEQKTKLDRAALNNKDLQANVKALQSKSTPPDDFEFDQPQGKITRRLPANEVEIDLGSNDRVTRGLVFTVLPSDFPTQGRQSRMREHREPDQRGNYRSVTRFTPKGTLEVVEVLGPNLSRARLTGEADRIRDAVLAGDLLYNAVWRKGQADHVALMGIFDLNGDGSDDTARLVKDLEGMGVTVDAVYDLRALKWKGQLTNQTRYLVEGATPTNTPNDPNRDPKTRMIGAMTAARDEARAKAIPVVKHVDFFGRMGYPVTPNVSAERVNQAAARFLTSVGAVEAPKGEGN
ncbi:MAG: hypothetical protein K2X82_06570 [Gemmataceae bacterium]|nr:hypothetical protein [Gemmataceae bacterium]